MGEKVDFYLWYCPVHGNMHNDFGENGWVGIPATDVGKKLLQNPEDDGPNAEGNRTVAQLEKYEKCSYGDKTPCDRAYKMGRLAIINEIRERVYDTIQNGDYSIKDILDSLEQDSK